MKKRSQAVDQAARLFGAILRRERVEAGMSQCELAAKADLNPCAISGYESGMRVPDLLSIRLLIEHLPGVIEAVTIPLTTTIITEHLNES